MHIAWAFDEFSQDPKRLLYIDKCVLGEDSFPLVLGAFKFLRKRVFSLRKRHFPLEHLCKDAADVLDMSPPRGFKFFERCKSHQPCQALLRSQFLGYSVRLAIVLHLQAMFDVAQETISS